MYLNVRLLSLSLVVILIDLFFVLFKNPMVRSIAGFRMMLYVSLVGGCFAVVVSFVPRP